MLRWRVGAGSDFDGNVANLLVELQNASSKADADWKSCNTTMSPSQRLIRRFELSVSPSGFNMNTVHRLLVTSGTCEVSGERSDCLVSEASGFRVRTPSL